MPAPRGGPLRLLSDYRINDRGETAFSNLLPSAPLQPRSNAHNVRPGSRRGEDGKLTIAACYVAAEGVVLGADSTASAVTADGPHYFNNNQKLFELGEDATLGVVTWGLGSLPTKSYRGMFATLADDLVKTPAKAVADVVARWIDMFWAEYSVHPLVTAFQALDKRPAFDKDTLKPAPNARSEDEEATYQQLVLNLRVGFCIGGYIMPDRSPSAYWVGFDPKQAVKPTPSQIQMFGTMFFGAPNLFNRLMNGHDMGLNAALMASGKWQGTAADLQTELNKFAYGHAMLPIRDAIDYVHACIYSTIKGLKFSSLSQICGGPIEIGVVTTDRRFRWVRHKTWDSAIAEGDVR